MIECISAITLATHNMPRAVRFYRILGFSVIHGGDDAAFTSFQAGSSYLNLIAQPEAAAWSHTKSQSLGCRTALFGNCAIATAVAPVSLPSASK